VAVALLPRTKSRRETKLKNNGVTMKKLVIILCVIFTLSAIGCYNDDEFEPEEYCTYYSDLCGDGGVGYYACANEYGSTWFEVGAEKYYTVEYMFDQECD